jgi:curved DNA-binding protein CbpA
MKGTLAEGVLPGVLRVLYVGRKTGTLHCENAGERRSVRFHCGTIINAQSSVVEERLGELLVRHGVVSAADLERATKVVIEEKRRLGRVFVDLGVLDAGGLEDGIALHVRDILTKVFSWNEGTYEFEETPERPVDEELTLKLSTGELILEAVRAIQDPDVVRYALGDLDRPLALGADPLLRFQKLTLSPSDGFVLSRVDGTLSAREILQLIPLPPEETQKSLFGLLCTGVIEAREGEPRRGGRAATERDAPAAPPPPSRPTPAPPPVAPATQPTSTPPRLDTAAQARRQEILDAYANLKAKNHFEVLGIPRASTEAQVKDAYFRMAKLFHPDVHHDPALVDLRDRLDAVFIRLGEAYETLRSPRTRAAYEERLGAAPHPQAGSASAPPAASALSPPRSLDPEAEVRAAEAQVRVAEKHFENEKYWDAIQALEPAVMVVTGKMRQRARVLLARSYLKNPKWVKRAEETLLAVIQDDDKNVDGHFLLGKIYKERGLKTRAQTMFRRTLELKPDHEEAAAELPTPGEEEDAPSGGSFIRKLFGKKE